MPRSISQQYSSRRREADAYLLRAAGHTYDEIAQSLGYSHASAARKAVRRFLDRIGLEDAQEVARLAYERYNAMLKALWPQVERANLAAIRKALLVMEGIERLYGLDLPPCSCRGKHDGLR